MNKPVQWNRRVLRVRFPGQRVAQTQTATHLELTEKSAKRQARVQYTEIPDRKQIPQAEEGSWAEPER